jgi:restriction system protein
MADEKKLSRSKALGAKVLYAALTILRDSEKEMPMRDLLSRVARKVDLDDWDKERYEKTGNVRWQAVLHFYSIDCVKAGYLIKKKGTWYLTPEGEEALKQGPVEFLNSAMEAYRKWKREQPVEPADETGEVGDSEVSDMDFEKIEQIAHEGIERYINKKNPYEFQDLVAALLRGMGYYTPFVAPKGKDGGIDIVAYRDPIGTQSPRIQVQIKHRASSAATVQEVRQLMGLLQKEGDVGIFVSTSGFSPDAKRTARSSHIHVELVDLSRFILLWQEFYNKMTDEDKALLSLTPIYFLAKEE